MDVPNYYNTFAGTVVTCFHLIFPTPIAEALNAFLIPIFLGPGEAEFVLDHYEPTLILALQENDVDLPVDVALDFGARGLGTLIKMMYAFVWQEQLIPGPWLYSPEDNIRGAEVMPEINAIGNDISGYNHTDDDLQDAINTYPGDYECRRQEPHSKWHEQSGNALIDLMWLTDDIDRVITGIPMAERLSHSGSPLANCMLQTQCVSAEKINSIVFPQWLVEDLSTCLPIWWEKWPVVDNSGFTNCAKSLSTKTLVNQCLPELFWKGDVLAFLQCSAALPDMGEDLQDVILSLTTCVAGPSSLCHKEAEQTMTVGEIVSECMNWCESVDNNSFHPLPWYNWPRSFACAAECFIDSKSMNAIRHHAHILQN
eukprot:c54390_g1_i1.p1 GENE.c54390_g1_i1~~c54390_g1_i1.p1  ORF type:complete len:376 (+),score=10.68 c54390_g1_i1:23-1129(+)